MKYTYAIDNGRSISFKDGVPYDGWYIQKYSAKKIFNEELGRYIYYSMHLDSPQGFKYTSKVELEGTEYDLYCDNLEDLVRNIVDTEEEKIEEDVARQKKVSVMSVTSEFYHWLKKVSDSDIDCLPNSWRRAIFKRKDGIKVADSWLDIWRWSISAVKNGNIYRRKKLNGEIFYSTRQGLLGKRLWRR